MSGHDNRRKGAQCVSVSLNELISLSQSAQELSLSAFLVKDQHAGQQRSRLFGRGMEFAESRRYQEGDDIRSIDWRVTARTGKVHTKLFTAEKERQVLLCVDLRPAMFFATKGVFKSVQASLLMGHLAWSAALNGNRLGGLIFNDHTQDEFRPALGKKGVLPLLQRLAEHSACPTPPKGNLSSSMDQAIASIKRVASPGSLIFVMSDFRHLSHIARDMLVQLSQHSDISLCFVYDPLEKGLPKNGHFPVSDGIKEWQLNTFNKKSLEKYQKQFIQRREGVASLSQYRHIHFIECSTEQDCFKLLKEHFR